jgi:hypothetical protein
VSNDKVTDAARDFDVLTTGQLEICRRGTTGHTRAAQGSTNSNVKFA